MTLLHRGARGRRTVSLDDSMQAARSNPASGLLGPNVAHSLLRCSAVRQDDVHQVVIPLPAPVQLDRGNDQSLVEDLPCRGRIRIGPMAAYRAEGDDCAGGEHGDRHEDVGKMGIAATIGVVLDEDISLFETVQREPVQDALQRKRHRCQVYGDVASALGHQLCLRRENRARNVSGILPKGRYSRSDHDVLHLARHREQGVANHLQRDRINAWRAHAIPPNQ